MAQSERASVVAPSTIHYCIGIRKPQSLTSGFACITHISARRHVDGQRAPRQRTAKTRLSSQPAQDLASKDKQPVSCNQSVCGLPRHTACFPDIKQLLRVPQDRLSTGEIAKSVRETRESPGDGGGQGQTAASRFAADFDQHGHVRKPRGCPSQLAQLISR